MIFQYINVCPVPREMLKTSAYGLGFQQLPRDLANVNAWKTMFDPYIVVLLLFYVHDKHLGPVVQNKRPLVNISLKFQMFISEICFVEKRCEKFLHCKSFLHFQQQCKCVCL